MIPGCLKGPTKLLIARWMVQEINECGGGQHKSALLASHFPLII